MKRSTLAVLFFVTFGMVLTVLAQGPGARGMGLGPYNTASETTVTGIVQAVQQHPGRRGGMGVHLLLKTQDSTLDVHVGPSWYLDKQEVKFAEGDTVEVTGSMLKTNDGILAKEIKKGDKSLLLRNATGRPLWAGPNKG
ncbi:MAG TPA: hypothetical protein VFU86_06945 [Terriglobales bacterium]|nr:hypothetical protein [Terriglobales bacterium]